MYEVNAGSQADSKTWQVTLSPDYASTATADVNTGESLYMFKQHVDLFTSRDWTSLVSTGDFIWTGDYEFNVTAVTDLKQISVSGMNFRIPLEGATFFKNGNGVERAMLFKLVDDDVSTARV